MKKITHWVAGIALVSPILLSTAPAIADETPSLSANVGWASEYYFRGVLQKESSASAGIDLEYNGFYAGTWSADVGDGLEIDGYFGYGIETESGFSASLGFSGYYYTGDNFDDTYEEINLNLGYGPLSLEYSAGTHDLLAGGEEDYDFVALTLEHNGFYGTYGSFGDDLDGEYIELGYGTSLKGFDMGVALILNSDELSDETDDDGEATEGEALIFTISKTFDL